MRWWFGRGVQNAIKTFTDRGKKKGEVELQKEKH